MITCKERKIFSEFNHSYTVDLVIYRLCNLFSPFSNKHIFLGIQKLKWHSILVIPITQLAALVNPRQRHSSPSPQSHSEIFHAKNCKLNFQLLYTYSCDKKENYRIRLQVVTSIISMRTFIYNCVICTFIQACKPFYVT